MAQADSLAITAQEYFRMREGPPYYQLIEGELHMSPSPHWRHQEIALNIAHRIKPGFRVQDMAVLNNDVVSLLSMQLWSDCQDQQAAGPNRARGREHL